MRDVAPSEKVFLCAEWRQLVFLNYTVDSALLDSYVPRGTEQDSFEGKTYVSLVGFRFSNVRLFGRLAVPFHSEFEEVNLRFYVRREIASEVRRGVVFIKEIVPKPAIALTARLAYGENYVWCPMKHKILTRKDGIEAEYSWKHRGNWSKLFARSTSAAELPAQSSLERYITEHYWGYSRQNAGNTREYQVKHSPWPVSIASDALFTGNAGKFYGEDFGAVLSRKPNSAIIANGSPVEVYAGAEIQ